MIQAFTIRVYGILMDTHKNVLVSDEIIRGKFYTKFPGGGLEFGEGTIECLVREFKEETGLTISIKQHLYTTDFFQPSAFNENDQVISIYYLVESNDINSLQISTTVYDFSEEQLSGKIQQENFRWIAIDELNEDSVTLPIDKKVVSLIKRL
ncbi:MAG: NUDIX domain-containing protein [Chitinophagaceae bacterium]